MTTKPSASRATSSTDRRARSLKVVSARRKTRHAVRAIMKDCLPTDDQVFPLIYSDTTEDRFSRIVDPDGSGATIDGPDVDAAILRAGTGLDWDTAEFTRAAERVLNLERANVVRAVARIWLRPCRPTLLSRGLPQFGVHFRPSGSSHWLRPCRPTTLRAYPQALPPSPPTPKEPRGRAPERNPSARRLQRRTSTMT